MKLSQGRHEGIRDWKVREVSVSLPAEQHVCIDELPLTTSAADQMATDSYYKWMSLKLSVFSIVENRQACQQSTKIDSKYCIDRQNCTGAIGGKRKAPWRQHVKPDCRRARQSVAAGEGHTIAKELADTSWGYNVDRILRVFVRETALSRLCTGTETSYDDTAEPPKHTPEHLITWLFAPNAEEPHREPLTLTSPCEYNKGSNNVADIGCTTVLSMTKCQIIARVWPA